METDLLNSKELAMRLKISPSTVKEWVKAGRIPAIRISRKTVRFDFSDVLRALREGQGGRHD